MPNFGCHGPASLRGGVHPDYIESVSADLRVDNTLKTRSYWLTFEPVHIINVTVSLIANYCSSDGAISRNDSYYTRERFEPLTVSLFTIRGWQEANETLGGWRPDASDADRDGRRYLSTCALTTSTQTSWSSPPEMFGMFCDCGLYVEAISPIGDDQCGRIVVNYVPRAVFPPSYADPIDHVKHYWNCNRDTPFLEGHYGGTQFNYEDATSTADPTLPDESVAADPADADWQEDASFGSSGFDSTASYPI